MTLAEQWAAERDRVAQVMAADIERHYVLPVPEQVPSG